MYFPPSCNGQHSEIYDCLKDSMVDYYLRQGGNVFAGFCLFVCLFVCVLAR